MRRVGRFAFGKNFFLLIPDPAENSAAVALTSDSSLGGYPYARHGQVNYPWLRVPLMNQLDEVSR